jgi:hypothetical protein
MNSGIMKGIWELRDYRGHQEMLHRDDQQKVPIRRQLASPVLNILFTRTAVLQDLPTLLNSRNLSVPWRLSAFNKACVFLMKELTSLLAKTSRLSAVSFLFMDGDLLEPQGTGIPS